MSTLTQLQTALGTIPVLEPASVSVPLMAATFSRDLRALMLPHFTEGQVYPETAGENRQLPDAVYQIGNSGVRQFQGLPIAHSTTFLVVIRADTYASMVELADAVGNTLEAAAGFDVMDMASDYEPDQLCYRVALEIEVSRALGGTASDARSVLLLPGVCAAHEPAYDNCRSQKVLCQQLVVLHAASVADLQALRLQVQTALLGWQRPDAYAPYQYLKGQPLETGGGLVAWVETYQDVTRIS